jgi:hypothetical protein
VFGDQDKELEQIEKEMKDGEENEEKQKARMEELQNELQQTIKRIE